VAAGPRRRGKCDHRHAPAGAALADGVSEARGVARQAERARVRVGVARHAERLQTTGSTRDSKRFVACVKLS
jgi:hypothetical protein